jgi:hypothetical protein
MCVCVCVCVEIHVIYIYLGTNHAGEMCSRVFMHNDVVVSDSQHVSRSGLCRETRQRVKTPIMTLKTRAAAEIPMHRFFFFILRSGRVKTGNEERHRNPARDRRNDAYNIVSTSRINIIESLNY